ncbi:putative toxin-antitoxin system toxin component, PIN family [Rudaea sp.]|uniref:putative toxin-antitoxin system toxin component, PIN family n=1 Tax=Rudaea sp. TaxID=2136325 RepID=UPI0032203EF2
MRFVERVVFDTSALVSAALRVESTPALAFRKALASHEICTLPDTLQELESVLLRAKFDRYLDRGERGTFLDLYRKFTTSCEVREIVKACRDPKDDKFLALAVSCGAGVLVSSDRDLLDLHPFRGVAIVTPADFLEDRWR